MHCSRKTFRTVTFGLGCAAVASAPFACKNRAEDGSDVLSTTADDDKAKKIAADIKSFNKTQQDLLAANTHGASACDKLDLLWNQIEATKQAETDLMPPAGIPKEIVTFGNGSANRFWRIFQGWGAEQGGSEIRPYEDGTRNYIRLTHRYGVLAKLKFVVNKDVVSKLGYTGQYAQGNDCVLGRFSSAVPTSVADRFTPAFASKFFVSGNAESQVLITQHDIGGQSSGTDETVTPPVTKSIDNNYYSHYLSNRLSFENGVYSGVGAFSRFFYSAQYMAKNVLKLDYVVDPRELQANHLAERAEDGTVIAKAKGPRFVWTVAPSPEMKAEFGRLAQQDSDFRHHFLALNQRMGENANKPVTMFNVYASDTWTYTPEKDATLIGQFVTNSEFVVSEAADVRLFFKHAVQFHKVPESAGEANPYTQDYPFAQWGDPLFTEDCRLGVRAAEVEPISLNPLDGTFIVDATANPATLRRDKDGNVCIVNIVKDKLEESLAPYLSKI